MVSSSTSRSSGVSATPRSPGLRSEASTARGRPLGDRRVPVPLRHRRVDQSPLDGGAAAVALGLGGEEVGAVTTDVALVDDAGQSARAGQHAQQRHLGQRHGRRAVVDQHDVVAGQGQLVAATGSGAVDRGDPGLARGRGRVLDAVAGLVGELAEVHLPRVRGLGEHPDVGAGAEHAVETAGQHHRLDLRVLEAQPLHGVVQLDVDTEVVGVHLQLVAGHQPAVLVDAEGQRGDLPVDLDRPVPVAVRRGVEVHDGRVGDLRGCIRLGAAVQDGHVP